jgi:hypothetical protein
MKATTLLAAALAGCATTPPVAAGPTATIGQTVYINGLKVRPVEVTEDSRCPTDVVCVWAGRIIVRTEVTGGSWQKTIDLEVGKPQQVADGALTLVAVHPPKQAGAETDPRAYRFTYDFQGGL